MDAWSFTWAPGALNDEGPLSEEAAVRFRDQVVRAYRIHHAVWVHAFAEVGIGPARFPAAVFPTVLENRRSAGIAGAVA